MVKILQDFLNWNKKKKLVTPVEIQLHKTEKERQ